MWSKKRLVTAFVSVVILLLTSITSAMPLSGASSSSSASRSSSAGDDLLFIHHSVGSNWLASGLEDALLAKAYVDERNDITYGTVVEPDAGRPGSLGDIPGNLTDMYHWLFWFSDYLQGVKEQGSANGFNRIVMFKSCYPNSNISSDGVNPGDPFSTAMTLTNFQAVYRHPDGPGHTYLHGGYDYSALEDIFAANPDVLFIPVTAPPLHYAPWDATNNANAHRARLFNNWLKNEWLPAYNAAHPGLDNVAVFDLFDVLAYPDDHPLHPNRLREEYGGASGDSHPNTDGNLAATARFAAEGAFLDTAWAAYVEAPVQVRWRQYLPLLSIWSVWP